MKKTNLEKKLYYLRKFKNNPKLVRDNLRTFVCKELGGGQIQLSDSETRRLHHAGLKCGIYISTRLTEEYEIDYENFSDGNQVVIVRFEDPNNSKKLISKEFQGSISNKPNQRYYF